MLFETGETEDFDFDDENEDGKPHSASFEVFKAAAPRAQGELIGHADIEKNLLDLFGGDRPPHAIIFAGPVGVGKSTMAFRLARFLLKRSQDEYDDKFMGASLFGEVREPAKNLSVAAGDSAFSRVASGGHSDLLTIERLYDEKKDRRKTEVAVDEIRKISPFMRKTPSVEGGWRIAIVDDADLMNRNSQNAILKILEEPPEKALLILVTHRVGTLLPTILSRASVQSFYPLADEELKNFLSRTNPELKEAEKNTLIDMAEGSLGRALSLAKPENLEIVREVFDLVARWPDFDWMKIQILADALGRGAAQETQLAFQDCFLWLTAAILKSKATGKAAFRDFDRFSRIVNEVSLAGWLQICDSLREHFIRVQTGNLDKKFMALGAFTVFENDA